jgi:Protein of unknown function (DUF4232)
MRRDDLDERLAGLAAEGARHARPPAPATIRRRSRRRRSRQAAWVGLGALTLAGAVVAGWAVRPAPAPPVSPRPTPTTTVVPVPAGQLVPWIPAPARPTPDHTPGPPEVPPGTPACAARQLRASTTSWDAATGTVAGSVTFTSRGAASCFLEGYPTIQLLDRHGKALALVGGRLSTSYQAPRPVLVRPGLAPRVEFHWSNWCGPDPGPISVRVTLPHGGSLIPTVEPGPGMNLGLTPRCDAPGSPSDLGRGPFVAEPVEPPPDPLADLEVRATLPPSAVAGQPLRYTVTLTNPTATSVSLRDCPSYEQGVSLESGGEAVERHLLNCIPVTAIGPGQAVTFAMVLELPATLPPGRGVLTWKLLRNIPASTKVAITVIGA